MIYYFTHIYVLHSVKPNILSTTWPKVSDKKSHKTRIISKLELSNTFVKLDHKLCGWVEDKTQS